LVDFHISQVNFFLKIGSLSLKIDAVYPLIGLIFQIWQIFPLNKLTPGNNSFCFIFVLQGDGFVEKSGKVGRNICKLKNGIQGLVQGLDQGARDTRAG